MDLLSKRLLVVSGKGGVGKTVVSSALALLAARRGKSVLVVKIDDHGRLAQLFETDAVGDRVRPLRENVSGVNLDPKTVIGDYIYSQLRIRRLVRHIVESQLFDAWYRVSPAIKEMILLGKVYTLVEEQSWWRKKPIWDLVVFDAPATGHGLGLLKLPEQASKLLIGPMRENALAVKSLLEDTKSTGIVIVTLPEEMPVNEAAHFYEQAGDSVPMSAVVLNQVFTRRLERDDLPRVPELLESAAGRAAWNSLAPGAGSNRALSVAAERAVERAELSAKYRQQLAERVPLPLVEVPYVFASSFGFAELERVAVNLARGLERAGLDRPGGADEASSSESGRL